MNGELACRLGVDVGGTFTDLVLLTRDGSLVTRKVLSTSGNYAEAIFAGIADVLQEAGVPGGKVKELIHGTTVATNAIIERRGARTGLVTTEGFRDLLEIGRLRLMRLYDMDQERPAPLVRRRWRFEVAERLDHHGEVIHPLDRDTLERAIAGIASENLQSVAVCLIHAYANPRHEQAVAASIRERLPQVYLTLSSEVLPEIREFERTSTTVANAYVMPVLDRYLSTLEAGLSTFAIKAPLLTMQSNGGVMNAAQARARPVQLIESGPAAGVIGAAAMARRLGVENVISLDMGGTTTKASVIEEYQIRRSSEFEVGGPISRGSRLNKGGGYLLRTPAIDIAEVGAGGGSILTVDDAGALHVGPHSAGAVPGPVCYGKGGTTATLTDANVTLGYLAQDRLPSGLQLDAAKARGVISMQLASALGLPLEEAAYGAYLVGCAGIARAVRAVTIERGRDPRDFTLIAFGGNGPLFAAEMARTLEIGTVLVPPAPGVFSAVGLLEAELEHHLVRTLNVPLVELTEDDLESAFEALAREARGLIRETASPLIDRAVDAKYSGQSFELTIRLPGPRTSLQAIAEIFAREHERTYGHRADADPVQIVNVRIVARLPRDGFVPCAVPQHKGFMKARFGASTRNAYFGQHHGILATPVLSRFELDRDKPRGGPLLIDEYDATTLVPPGCSATLDHFDNIVIRIED
ncbi:MAG: hydantoinase/oxoprolinase family protein [Alphaproteobacteria bacterium]|nr:hydantoinase/oxoprolinase family protein [Alphaproteobacteria bacterium]